MLCCTPNTFRRQNKSWFLAYVTIWSRLVVSFDRYPPRYDFLLVMLSSTCGLHDLQGSRWSSRLFCGQAKKWQTLLSFTFQPHGPDITARASRKYGFPMCSGRGNGIGEHVASLCHIHLVLFPIYWFSFTLSSLLWSHYYFFDSIFKFSIVFGSFLYITFPI